ncbi:T9SS type A sorting domain-containing protein [bacterium]|nr:T9SS type A sorting domain-containing protein [bacterium]
MKRIYQLIIFAMILTLPVHVWSLTHFDITADNSVQAGANFNVSIQAQHEGAPDGTYAGKVLFEVSPNAGTVSPTSGEFSDGTWSTSTMQIFTANDTVTITCTDAGGATGIATIDVNPGPATQLLIFMPGQTRTPGIWPGADPNTATVFNGVSYSVTVYAVDDYWNIDPTYNGLMDLDCVAGTVTPDSTTASNGAGNFSVFFPLADFVDLIANTPVAASETVNVQSTTEAWTHIAIPTQITAGVPFKLTLTVSTSDNDPNQILPSNNSSYDIKVRMEGTQTDAAGILTPRTTVTVSSGYYSDNDFAYNLAERVYLIAEVSGSSDITIHPKESEIVEVLPNIPDSIQVSISPDQVQSKHHANVNVTVLDAWGNPTRSSLHNFDVAFQIISGGGSLSLTQTATAADGTTTTVFTGGNQNETAQVQITVADISGSFVFVQETHSVRVTVASTTPGSVVNYPNPFNPAQNQTTSINYYLEEASDVEIRVYDPFGRLVLGKDLKKDDTDRISQTATQYGGAEYVWDGKNGEGRVVANGIYFVRILAKTGSKTTEYKRRVGVVK